jgi:hypothetical protein
MSTILSRSRREQSVAGRRGRPHNFLGRVEVKRGASDRKVGRFQDLYGHVRCTWGGELQARFSSSRPFLPYGHVHHLDGVDAKRI